MTEPTTLGAAFLLGLFSTAHCIGMCGGIIGALSLGLPEKIRTHKLRLLMFISSYNVGRILSYTFAGLIANTLMSALLFADKATDPVQGHKLLQMIGVVMMVAVGLYLAGWLPQLSRVEKIGLPLWRKLEPLGRRLLPVTTLPQALLYGMIWGWLPCGMVYFVLIWTLTSGDAIHGALIMLAFGLGTLPTLLSAGLAAPWLTSFTRSPLTRQVAGILIIALAIGTLFIPMQMQNH